MLKFSARGRIWTDMVSSENKTNNETSLSSVLKET